VVFLEGTEGSVVSGCVFERVDGNAVLLSAYNRNVSIVYNEFAWIGATAVALWGNTEGGDPRLPPGYGYSGVGGNQPRNNIIAFNLCHELGVWEKQVRDLPASIIFVQNSNSFSRHSPLLPTTELLLHSIQVQ